MAITKPPVLPSWAEAGDKVQPSNAEIQAGWPLSSIPPSRQRFNWLLNFLANGIRYFSRRGLPDYDAAETYMTGDRIIGDDGKTYRSLIDNNTAQMPSTSPTKWEPWALTQSQGDVRVQNNAAIASAAGGTADAITGSYSPAITALTNGMSLYVRASSANATTTPTFKADGTAGKTIVKGAGAALAVGDIAGGGHWIELQYDATLDRWVLLNPATGVQAQGKFANVQQFNASTTLTVGQLGSAITFFGSTPGQTITLPPVASAVGGMNYWIQNTSGQSVTIKANASESIGTIGPGMGYLGSNTLILAPGDSTCIFSTQSQWYETAGVRAAAFGASSLSANGYQKLPSGLIIQWGLVTTNGSGVGAVTFPIAFPSACYSVNVTADVAVSQFANISGAISLTGFTANSYTSNTGAAAASLSVYWIAIGK